MNKKNLFKKLESKLGKGRVKIDLPLSKYTTMRVGGPAQFLFIAEIKDDLVKSFALSCQLDLNFTILGGGSNVAVTDKGIKGLVVINRLVKKEIVGEDSLEAIVKVSSGYPVTRLVKELIEEGLGGLEYHSGLPGTLGGAIFMNSKWTHPTSYVGDNLIKAELITKKGEVREVKKSYFNFAYDYSILQRTGELLLTATFRLKKEDKNKLQERAKLSLKYRLKTQPFGVATSGCFFKNVEGKSAGRLIDQVGLKGYQIGNFLVSDKHANFITNQGGGKSKDLLKLVNLVKKKVKDKFGVELEEEVIVM